jgi:hypothetical protein
MQFSPGTSLLLKTKNEASIIEGQTKSEMKKGHFAT